MASPGKTQLTPFAKLSIVAVIVVGAFFGFKYAQKSGLLGKIVPSGKGTSSSTPFFGSKKSEDCIQIGVVTWGGYAGGQFFNNGFECSENSRYFTEYGIKVGFKLLDFVPSRDAFKANAVQGLWATIDAYPTEAEELSQKLGAKVVMQVDKSRGGDAIVVRRGINSAADLRGKKIAVAEMTPSHTFLLWLLEANNMTYADIHVIKVESAIDAAKMFKDGQSDASVVWSPDDADLVQNVPGAKILVNTKSASDIIYDVMIFSNDVLTNKRNAVKAIVAGWLRGAAELNSNTSAKQKAAQILSVGLNQPVNFCVIAINNVRLTTLGDNINFFNLNGNYTGVKGEDLYNKMTKAYSDLGLIAGKVPAFRQVTDPSIIRDLMTDPSFQGPEHAAETHVTFQPATKTIAKFQAFSSKKVRINFSTGSFSLDENMKYIIDQEFTTLAKGFAQARVRVEGNTDNVGSAQLNRSLSLKRANSVVDYLVTEHQFDRNRFIVIGNGPDKPECPTNDSEDCRAKNRRTDFELIAE